MVAKFDLKSNGLSAVPVRVRVLAPNRGMKVMNPIETLNKKLKLIAEEIVRTEQLIVTFEQEMLKCEKEIVALRTQKKEYEDAIERLK